MWNPRSLGLCLSLFSLLACKTMLKPSDTDPAATASTKPVNPDTPKTPEPAGASDKPPVSTNPTPVVEEPNLGSGNSNAGVPQSPPPGGSEGTGGSNPGNSGGGTTNPGTGNGGTANGGTGTNAGTGGTNNGDSSGGDTTRECVSRVISFEKSSAGKVIQRGEQISKQYADWGIEITSHRVKSDGQWDENRPPIIFDSSERPNAAKRKEYQRVSKAQSANDDGFDSDLSTSKNRNVLIIAENYYSEAGNSLVSYPDDNYWGGRIVFIFQKPAKVQNVEIIDNESDAAKLEFRDQFNALKYTQKVVGKQNGNLQNIAIGNSGFIRSMTLTLPSGGAIDNIALCIEK